MGKIACKLQHKNVGADAQSTTRVHVPEARERRWSSAFGDHAVGGEVKGMMPELGGDAKISDLWRMSALLEICPNDVKEQMLMRLDEIAENYENIKAKGSTRRPEGDDGTDGTRLRERRRDV